MQSYKNIYLLGTSHISVESINQVKEFIESNKPEIVAIELDKKRLYSLLHKRKLKLSDVKSLGIKGFIIHLIAAYIEKKLGKLVGTSPGDEMKTAINLVKEHKLSLALIDQDIEITLKKLAKAITWREKLRFVKEIIKGLITRKPQIEPFDLRKVPPKKTIKKMISLIRTNYPGVYKVLIEERNEVMAKNLYNLITKYPDKKIFAIVGAGHEEDIFTIIVVTISVLFLILGYKLAARYYGNKAKFQLWRISKLEEKFSMRAFHIPLIKYLGQIIAILITLLSSGLTYFAAISTFSTELVSKRKKFREVTGYEDSMTSIIGITSSFIALFIFKLANSETGVLVNTWIIIGNLIPFSSLPGSYVLMKSRTSYIFIAALSLLLLILIGFLPIKLALIISLLLAVIFALVYFRYIEYEKRMFGNQF